MLLALIVIRPSVAAEFTGYVALTSDYVKRGVSQSDNGAALQLGADISFDSGFFAGAWGSSVDIDNEPTGHRDRELNLYVGYDYDVSDIWRLSANIVSYEYPRQTGDIDYNYVEYTLAVNYDDRLWLEYAYSPDLYNLNRSSDNVELFAEFSLSENWSVGSGVGYYDVSNLTGQGYGYWQVGATRNFRYANIDIRFHDTNRSVFIVSTDDLARARLAVTVIVPF